MMDNIVTESILLTKHYLFVKSRAVAKWLCGVRVLFDVSRDIKLFPVAECFRSSCVIIFILAVARDYVRVVIMTQKLAPF